MDPPAARNRRASSYPAVKDASTWAEGELINIRFARASCARDKSSATPCPRRLSSRLNAEAGHTARSAAFGEPAVEPEAAIEADPASTAIEDAPWVKRRTERGLTITLIFLILF